MNDPTTETTAAGGVTVPTLHIVLELERAPVVYADCANESEHARLLDWLESQPGLTELVVRAQTMRSRRAA